MNQYFKIIACFVCVRNAQAGGGARRTTGKWWPMLLKSKKTSVKELFCEQHSCANLTGGPLMVDPSFLIQSYNARIKI